MRLRSPRAVLLAGAAGTLVLVPAGPASAHHGWDHFDTTAALYVSGTVTDVRWGNPHPEVTLRVERTGVPRGWADREIPPELEDIGGRQVMEATRPYTGDSDRVTLALAPVERLAAWGMEGDVAPGEQLQAVGYPAHDHDDELRPELIVLEDGQTVRQRSVPLPQPPEPSDPGGRANADGNPPPGATGADPDSDESTTAATTTAADPHRASSDTAAWLVTGGAFLLLLTAGGYAIVRRSNRS